MLDSITRAEWEGAHCHVPTPSDALSRMALRYEGLEGPGGDS